MIHHTEQLRTLVDDWDRYALLPDPEWRKQMQSAVVVEMRAVVNELAHEVDPPKLPKPSKRRRWYARR